MKIKAGRINADRDPFKTLTRNVTVPTSPITPPNDQASNKITPVNDSFHTIYSGRNSFTNCKYFSTNTHHNSYNRC